MRKEGLLWFFPDRWVLPYAKRKSWRKRSAMMRQEVFSITVQDNFEIDTYWKAIQGLGYGPAFAGYVEGLEVFRFDCFGDNGHYHFYYSKRFSDHRIPRPLATHSTAEQIDESIGIMTRDLASILKTCRFRTIRNFVVDQPMLTGSLPDLKSRLLARESPVS